MIVVKVYFGITDNYNEKSLNGVVINATVFMPPIPLFLMRIFFQIFATAKFDLISSSDEEKLFVRKSSKKLYRILLFY